MPQARLELGRPKTVASHWYLLLHFIVAEVKTREAVYIRYTIEMLRVTIITVEKQ
jgi:hypothetical protein